MRETFQAAPSTRERTFDWNWPAEMQEVGRCEAVMYASDKWQMDGSFEDYKHVAEAPQELLVVPGFLVDHQTKRPLETHGPTIVLDGDLPKHFAILSELLGIQMKLYTGTKRDGDGKLPRGDSGYYEVRIARGMLGGAHMPDTGEPFLFAYTASGGIHCLVFGSELDVEKDGIVG